MGGSTSGRRSDYRPSGGDCQKRDLARSLPPGDCSILRSSFSDRGMRCCLLEGWRSDDNLRTARRLRPRSMGREWPCRIGSRKPGPITVRSCLSGAGQDLTDSRPISTGDRNPPKEAALLDRECPRLSRCLFRAVVQVPVASQSPSPIWRSHGMFHVKQLTMTRARDARDSVYARVLSIGTVKFVIQCPERGAPRHLMFREWARVSGLAGGPARTQLAKMFHVKLFPPKIALDPQPPSYLSDLTGECPGGSLSSRCFT